MGFFYGRQRCQGLSRTQLRRIQRKAHVACLLRKVREASQQRNTELHKRLQMAAPVVAAGIDGLESGALLRQRRNAALHCYDVAADVIQHATSTQLNAIQRSRRSSAIPPSRPPGILRPHDHNSGKIN